jgi:hypothetical protein
MWPPGNFNQQGIYVGKKYPCMAFILILHQQSQHEEKDCRECDHQATGNHTHHKQAREFKHQPTEMASNQK